MKKYIFLFLLIFVTNVHAETIDGMDLDSAATVDGMDLSSVSTIDGMAYSGTSCVEDYTCEPTIDGDRNLSASASTDYVGAKYTPTGNICVCAIDLYVRDVNGTMSEDHDFYVRIFEMSGDDITDMATGGLGTSGKINGSSFNDGGEWLSEYAGLATFGTCVNLTASTDYAITIFMDTDGNTSDDPEDDSVNYIEIGYDNSGSSCDAQMGGVATWRHSDGSDVIAIDTADEMALRVHSE